MDASVSGSVAEIADLAVRLEAAFNARDAVALASLYSDAAVLMPPHEPIVNGRPRIQVWFEHVLPRVGGVSIVPLESTAVGNQGFQVGTFTSGAQTDASSSSTTDSPARTGKYVLLLKRSEGQWKIQYDIWNLDQLIE